MKILINENILGRVGSHWLHGQLLDYVVVNQCFPEEVTLVFQQTSDKYRREHDGPKVWLLAEYNVPCLLEDMVLLQSKGVRFHIEIEYVED